MVATKTKPRKPKFIEGGGPYKQKITGEAEAALKVYEKKAARALRTVIQEGGADYEKLQARLAKQGIQITRDALENKIARGTFTTAFLLQCMDALGVDKLAVPRE